MTKHDSRPNLLFVFSDQHRWCDIGCYGNDQVITPNLDAFSKKATQVENCIANCPVCVPSRGIMLTGMYPLQHGAAGNDLPMYDNVETMGNVLLNHGYTTGYIGKWHLAGIPRDQFIPAGTRRFGFQEWKVANCTHNYLNAYYDDEENKRHPIQGYDAIEQTNLALDFIERHHDKSWGLVLSWGPPHDPYHAVPKSFLDKYEQTEIRMRPNVTDQSVQIKDKLYLSKKQIKENIKGYYAHISALDEQFGRLIRKLEHTGQLSNTIIVYTSDHGDMLGSQGMTNKQLPYEESIKVPLLVYWQGKTIPMKREELIGLVDLPVSILGMMGLEFKDSTVVGQDLHGLFIDPNAKGRDYCYIFELTACHQATNRGTLEWRGIRTDRYTFAKHVYDPAGWLLFDNVADPYQLNNVVNEPALIEIRDELEAKLKQEVTIHDYMLPWKEIVGRVGLKERWEESELYFQAIQMNKSLMPPIVKTQ
ncbi:sulfatase [Paenibacillus sp. JSM ZJ436]|uniref:sulfatase n=1 Tax=Paenibacillus sp. JSM ZJ436 TaxID=3376190 RepID=UPI0037884754